MDKSLTSYNKKKKAFFERCHRWLDAMSEGARYMNTTDRREHYKNFPSLEEWERLQGISPRTGESDG